MVVLDTDHLSLLDWEAGARASQLAARLSGSATGGIATTIVNFEEQMRGWLAYLARARTVAQQIEAYRRLARYLQRYCRITVLDFDERSAVEFQRLRTSHRRIGFVVTAYFTRRLGRRPVVWRKEQRPPER